MIYLKVDRKYAFISALIYILNGHMAKLLLWGWGTTLAGYSLFPLAMLFGIKAVKEKEVMRNSIIAGIVFAIMLRLNPDMKSTMWLPILFGLYLLFNILVKFSVKRLVKTVSVALLIFVVFFGLSAIKVIPNADFIGDTSRGATTWEKSSTRQLSYNDMFNRVIEPVYKGMPKIQRRGTGDHIGIIALLLVVFAIYKKHKNKNVMFFSLAALFALFVATNTFKMYYLLWRFFPFFKSLRYMDRSLFLFVFSASILAGIGAMELIKKTRHKKIVYWGLVVLIILNLWVFNYTHYSGGDPSLWSNAREARENNYILQDLGKREGIFRINTWETRGIDWGTGFYNIPLGLEHIYSYDSIWYPPYMNSYLAASYLNPSRFWGMLNVKYLTSQSELNLSGFRFVKKFDNCTVCFPEEGAWAKAWGPYLYENEMFLPRAYIVDNSILVVGEEEAVTQTIYGLMLNDGFNPSNTVIIRGKGSINEYDIESLNRHSVIFLTKGSIDQNSRFILEQYVGSGGVLVPDITKNQNSVSEDEVGELFSSFEGDLNPVDDDNVIMHDFDTREIKGLSGKTGFLVYSEKFSVFDGWTAEVDGNRKEIYNANSMNTAIYLEGDVDSIVFEYKPTSFKIGSVIFLITILLLLLYFVYAYFHKRRKVDEV